MCEVIISIVSILGGLPLFLFFFNFFYQGLLYCHSNEAGHFGGEISKSPVQHAILRLVQPTIFILQFLDRRGSNKITNHSCWYSLQYWSFVPVRKNFFRNLGFVHSSLYYYLLLFFFLGEGTGLWNESVFFFLGTKKSLKMNVAWVAFFFFLRIVFSMPSYLTKILYSWYTIHKLCIQ